MSSPITAIVQEALAALETQRDSLAENKRRREAIRATATAPRKAVAVTVGGMGEVVEIKFPTSAYKGMTPKELAAVLVKTIGEARSQALDEYAELLAPTLPPGLSAQDVVHGRVQPGDLLTGKLQLLVPGMEERKS